jgi:hypothetical protein
MVQVSVPLAGMFSAASDPAAAGAAAATLFPEYFYTKVQHLNWMLESIAADIRQGSQPWQGGAIDKAHQLIPIQKFMTRWVCGGGVGGGG